MEKGDAILGSGYFNCERLHAKIPKTTCFARQFALVQGSRRFLFPECGSCSQGKVIVKEQQKILGGEKEKSLMADQAKSENEASEGRARICEDCGEKPTISPRSPYCSSCMQKRAIKARKSKQGVPKKAEKERAVIKPLSQGNEVAKPETAIRVDFSGQPEILKAVERLAEEEIRPVEHQVIYILKTFLRGQKTSLKEPIKG